MALVFFAPIVAGLIYKKGVQKSDTLTYYIISTRRRSLATLEEANDLARIVERVGMVTTLGLGNGANTTLVLFANTTKVLLIGDNLVAAAIADNHRNLSIDNLLKVAKTP